MKNRILHCNHCKQDSFAKLSNQWSVLYDMPKIPRVVIAIITLGISEIMNNATIKNEYTCLHCGHVLSGRE